MSVTVNDNISSWSRDAKSKIDSKIASTALAVMRLSQLQYPLLTGALRSSHRVDREALGKYVVSANTPYARRQHFENRKRSLYLKKAGDNITRGGLA